MTNQIQNQGGKSLADIQAEIDKASVKAIEQNNYGLMSVPTNALDKATARDSLRTR